MPTETAPASSPQKHVKVPELLAPAGTLRNMRYALAYGADAVYAGQPRYSLRVRNNDFQLENLETGIRETHGLGKKFFVASNISPHNAKLQTYLSDMEPVIAMAPDALIMADPGLIMMVRERWPQVPIHLSVQSNTVNYAAVRFWQSVGIQRVILSRELSLDEIAEIRQQCPDMELEVFVHGALCIAYSGRCLLSGYFNHRDPNQGTCTNACRWQYQLHDTDTDVTGDVVMKNIPVSLPNAGHTEKPEPDRHPLADKTYLLEESERPGQYMPILEDEHGTYIMNSKDLRAIEHIPRLLEIGVDSLKIEGRTKSHYYAARTAQIYRRAIDMAAAGEAMDPTLIGNLDALANRGYTDGFYQRHHSKEYQNYLQGASDSVQQRFVGEITGFDDERNLAEVLAKNQFCRGDELELILPKGNHRFTLDYIENHHGQAMDKVPGGGYQVRIPVPVTDVERGLLAKQLSD